MKVSIIVPVYGVEKYLNACIESIVKQTHQNLEIILIDDGSPDNCPEMCDEWVQKDDRIKVIHKENGGQGTARNAALDIMTGDYVLFVDSDDRILPTMVEKLLAATNNGKIDLVLCGYTVDNILRTVDTNWYAQSRLYTTKEILFEYLTAKKIVVGPICKLISKSLIADIRFPVFRSNEDAYIMHEIFGNCNCAYILSDYLYIQNIREGSTEQSAFNINKMHLIDCAYSLREYVDKNYPKYSAFVRDKVAQYSMILLDKMYVQNACKHFPECEAKLKNILSDEIKNLETGSKIYRQIDLYLNKHFLYVIKVKIKFVKIMLRGRIKKCLCYFAKKRRNNGRTKSYAK